MDFLKLKIAGLSESKNRLFFFFKCRFGYLAIAA